MSQQTREELKKLALDNFRNIVKKIHIVEEIHKDIIRRQLQCEHISKGFCNDGCMKEYIRIWNNRVQ